MRSDLWQKSSLGSIRSHRFGETQLAGQEHKEAQPEKHLAKPAGTALGETEPEQNGNGRPNSGLDGARLQEDAKVAVKSSDNLGGRSRDASQESARLVQSGILPEAEVLEGAAEAKALNLPRGDQRLATLQALNHLAQHPKLQEKLAGTDGRIDLKDLTEALLLNGEIRSGSRLPTGIAGFLSDADKEAVQTLAANWKLLEKESFDTGDLNRFTLEDIRKNLSQELKDELDKAAETGKNLSTGLSDYLKERLRTGLTPDRLEVAPPPYPGTDIPPSMVRTSEFSEAAMKLFDRLNTNKDDFLSDKELAAALEDPQHKREDAQVVAALYFYRSRLANGADDGSGGVTKADLKSFDSLERRITQDLADSWDVENVGRDTASFRALDRSNKGYLTREDLEKAASNGNLTETQRKGAEIVLRHYQILPGASDDYILGEGRGITPKDLQNFSNALNQSEEYRGIKETAHALRRTYWGQLKQVDTLYQDSARPLESINPEAINQGLINDCYFLSSLGATAFTNPELIRDMIKDNQNGTFTVTFPGAKNEPVTVKAPTEAERGIFNQPGQNGLWASVIEKAYGAYCQRNFLRRTPMNWAGGDSPTEGADGGGWYSALQVLTGKPYVHLIMPITPNNTIARSLNEALNQDPKHPVIADTGPGRPFRFSENTKDGFARAHIFMVLGFDPKGADGGTVTIANPWGGPKGTTSGEKQISFKEFNENFFNVAHGQD